LLDDLEARSALPRDNVHVIEAGNDRSPTFGSDSPGNLLTAFGPSVEEDDLGSLGASTLDLHGGRVGGHNDGRVNAKATRSDRHAASVISGGESDDASLPLLVRKLQQPVGCAPQLERPASLQALALQPDAIPANFGFDERRALHLTADPLGRSKNVIKRNCRTRA
jgi:hypothetical protein